MLLSGSLPVYICIFVHVQQNANQFLQHNISHVLLCVIVNMLFRLQPQCQFCVRKNLFSFPVIQHTCMLCLCWICKLLWVLVLLEMALICFAYSRFFHDRVLQRYVQKETELVKSLKSNVTATTMANRQKKMADVCSLIKYFIRCANERKGDVFARSSSGLNLNISDVNIWLYCVCLSRSVQAGLVWSAVSCWNMWSRSCRIHTALQPMDKITAASY